MSFHIARQIASGIHIRHVAATQPLGHHLQASLSSGCLPTTDVHFQTENRALARIGAERIWAVPCEGLPACEMHVKRHSSCGWQGDAHSLLHRRAIKQPVTTDTWSQMSAQPPDAERRIWIYHQMLRIREFEERVKRTFTDHPGVIRGHTHLGDGTEASIVGSLCHFHSGDAALATYRCHGYPLVLGSDPKAMMAEIYGRVDGLCKGLGGSMHLTDVKRGFLGTSGIVGAGIPHAAGAAWAAQLRKKSEVVYCFFGDGASKQGAFHETLNIASLWKLPVIFIMENNGYNVETTSEQEDANAANGEPLSVKAKAYSMPGVTVDGADPIAVHATVGTAVERARAGAGPTLIESKVYRLSAHGNIIAPPGVPLHYPEHEAIAVFGKREEYEAALRGDPVPRFRAALVNAGVLTSVKADELRAQVAVEMDDAVDFAIKSAFPAVEAALDYVYA